MLLKNRTAWLKHNLFDLAFIIAIAGVCVFIAFKNYVPGTWLMGWDNLMPELNLKLNIARSFSAVWQEYQGLGLLGGMAHAADLPRQTILLLASVIFPASFLRYFWTFLMLIAGPTGVYFLISKNLVAREEGIVAKLAGFSAAVFYLFNLATVQTFFTPFEAFVGFFAFLPWLLWSAIGYLKEGGTKRLAGFAVISLLSVGSFYVQTLFAVYGIFLFVIALEAILRQKKTGMSRSFKLAITAFFINAFWLLPVLYFTLTSGHIPANSHINSIATPETQLMNAARNDTLNIATLKGYWFDYYDWGERHFDYLYRDWIAYSTDSRVINISIALFALCLFGLTLSIFKKKTSFGVSFAVLFAVSYFMLSGHTISWIPLFSEIFRNSYTKWSTAAAIIYAVGLGFFVYSAGTFIRGKVKYFLAAVLSLAVVGGSIFAVKPILSGKLISDSMRVSLPNYYLDAFAYFNSLDPAKRIVLFPLTDLFGWKFNDWGYRGSGFLWYGIRQPILDRAFDVWSPYNEAFYNEIASAINAGDPENLKYVLSKYNVSYIFFDGSIIQPGNPSGPAIFKRQKDFLESNLFISKDAVFGEITIYKVDTDKVNLGSSNSFVDSQKADFSGTFLKLTGVGAPVVKETFPTTQGYPEPKNCDLKLKGAVTRERTADGNFYGAYDGGINCDYFYYSSLDYSKGYILHIKGQNLNGRSVKFYLLNVKDQEVQMQELLPSGDFDKSYVVLPTSSKKEEGLGYTLTVETRSFGRLKSENRITSIEFLSADVSVSAGPELVLNNLNIKNVKKYATWGYKFDIQNSGLIELNQGYDPGWVAFRVRKSGGGDLITLLPHVKLNFWNNGWLATGGVGASGSDRFSVYVIYWPQILEVEGLLLSFGTLIILLLRIRSSVSKA